MTHTWYIECWNLGACAKLQLQLMHDHKPKSKTNPVVCDTWKSPENWKHISNLTSYMHANVCYSKWPMYEHLRNNLALCTKTLHKNLRAKNSICEKVNAINQTRQSQSKNHTKNRWESVASLEDESQKKHKKYATNLRKKPRPNLWTSIHVHLWLVMASNRKTHNPPKFPSLSCHAVPHFKPFVCLKILLKCRLRPIKGNK